MFVAHHNVVETALRRSAMSSFKDRAPVLKLQHCPPMEGPDLRTSSDLGTQNFLSFPP